MNNSAVTTMRITLTATAMGMALTIMSVFSHHGRSRIIVSATAMAMKMVAIRKPLQASSTFKWMLSPMEIKLLVAPSK